jgi:predicted nucleic acid-binding protein
MTHLLDTSAILAHYLDESGADEVESLLAQGPGSVALAAPSWVELDTRLRELVSEVEERENAFLQYTVSLTTLLPVDAESSLAAIRLRNAAPGRLPLADALIAGVADAAGLTLVHRDPHFDTIPGMKVLRLPGKD